MLAADAIQMQHERKRGALALRTLRLFLTLPFRMVIQLAVRMHLSKFKDSVIRMSELSSDKH